MAASTSPGARPSTCDAPLRWPGCGRPRRDLCRWRAIPSRPGRDPAGRRDGGRAGTVRAVPPTRCPTAAVQFNLAQAFDTLVESLADRECIVWRDRRLTYAHVAERSTPPGLLPPRPGPGPCTASGPSSPGTESGQDHVALALYNGNEYLEGMLGSYRARLAPFNVNYRYVGEELRYLLNDARPAGPDPPRLAGPRAGRGAAHARRAPRRAAPGGRRLGPRPPPRGGRVRGGAGRLLARRRPRSSPRPTTSTSSTPAARPACPRACCGASTTSSWPPWAGGRWAPGRS